jgi:hypothetical protein
MKKTVLIITLTAAQALQLHAWSIFSSSNQENNSATNMVSSTVSSSEGGAVNVDGKTYDLEPGQTLEYSSSKSLSSSTIQEPGKEPVTTTVIEEQEPTVLINGKPANEMSEPSAADLPSGVLAVYQDGQLISGEEPTALENASAEEAADRIEKAELDAEIEAYLDFGDGYES